MTKTWLILDCNELCHAAFHSINLESADGVKVGVVYGFFRTIRKLMDLHATENIIFCFDKGKSARCTLQPNYKAHRVVSGETPADEALKEARKELYRQIRLLRKKYLPKIGFKNVFAKNHYEADDIIASLCKHTIPETDKVIIISSDKDLYQLLSKNVCMWSNRSGKATTYEQFLEEYKFGPHWWPYVKAIAGCKSDNISGIFGVGEVSAIKYVRELISKTRIFNENDTRYAKIIAIEGQMQITENLKVIRLPFPKTGVFDLKEDEVTPKRWKKIIKKLELPSLEASF